MDKYRRIAAEFGAEFVDLTKVKFTPELFRCIPAELARKYRALPVSESGRRIAIVMSDPADLPALNGLHSALDREIELRVAEESQLDIYIQRFYGDDKSAA